LPSRGADRDLAALGDHGFAEVGAGDDRDLDAAVGHLPTCAIEEDGPIARSERQGHPAVLYRSRPGASLLSPAIG
jgi:hypothetical protein